MSTVLPYLSVHDATAALEYYQRAFGATVTLRMTGQDGRIDHAEISVGGARIMLADEWPEGDIYSPKHYGGTSVTLTLDVPNVDELFQHAVDAGATAERAVADQFHGSRSGTLVDPFGHRWIVSTKIADVDVDTMRERVGDEYSIATD